MKRLVFISFLILLSGVMTEVVAQIPGARIPPRVDDHYWRRKVVNRLDLSEKINQPLTFSESPALYGNPAYGETHGIVVALINGLKSGKYLAYHPDSLNKSLTYEDVVKIAQQISGDGGGESFDEEDSGFDEFEGEDEFSGEEMGDDMGDSGTEGDSDPETGGGTASEGDFSVASYESVLEFIEDRIFDKNRSDMVYDIQYLRLVWVDPGETLPDKNFVCFRYADVLETLEDTQWKNKFNDAEYRNMREIFELRLFSSYILDVSGRGVKTLEESDFRRNQLVEFEHDLWCF
jgi:Gliding motility associated protein GldN